MAEQINDETMDFVWDQCRKLSDTIIIANDLADGKASFMKYSQTEHLRLTEQFAQATGVFMACVLVAEEQGKETSVVERYQSYQDVFTQYGYQAGRLCGEFATDDDLTEYLEGLAALVIEQLDCYGIEPMRLHDAAMQAVEDYERENAEETMGQFD